jgi:hypothetical protein
MVVQVISSNKTDGTFFYWGSNVFNQYGNNSTVASTIPFLISCPTSLSNLDSLNTNVAAPNPSKGIFYHINRKFLEDAIISVVDLNGRIIYNSTQKSKQSSFRFKPFTKWHLYSQYFQFEF